jgi:hypothetical protein
MPNYLDFLERVAEHAAEVQKELETVADRFPDAQAIITVAEKVIAHDLNILDHQIGLIGLHNYGPDHHP